MLPHIFVEDADSKAKSPFQYLSKKATIFAKLESSAMMLAMLLLMLLVLLILLMLLRVMLKTAAEQIAGRKKRLNNIFVLVVVGSEIKKKEGKMCFE